MPTGIMRVVKLSAEPEISAKGEHYNRGGGYVSISNPDIDPSRTKDNYSLLGEEVGSLMARVNRRIADGHTVKRKDGSPKPIRHDAVRVVDFIFALSDRESADRHGRDYFEDCRKWAAKVFGTENIVSAVVHVDEETPHLHLAAVPIVDGRLSARAVLGGNKLRMRELQDDFYADVCQKRGLERGQPVEETKRRHLSVRDFKRQCNELDVVKQVKAIKPGLTGKTVPVPVGLHSEVCAISLYNARKIAEEREKRYQALDAAVKYHDELKSTENALREARADVERLEQENLSLEKTAVFLKDALRKAEIERDNSYCFNRTQKEEFEKKLNDMQKRPEVMDAYQKSREKEQAAIKEAARQAELRRQQAAKEAAAKQAAEKARQKERAHSTPDFDF